MDYNKNNNENYKNNEDYKPNNNIKDNKYEFSEEVNDKKVYDHIESEEIDELLTEPGNINIDKQTVIINNNIAKDQTVLEAHKKMKMFYQY